MKKIILLLLLLGQLSFSQVEKDDYQLYSLILTERLKLGNNTEKDKIVLIEQFKDKFDGTYHVFNHENDSITNSDLIFLYSMTYKDTTFLRRLTKEKDLRNVVVQLTSDKSEHPKINAELLQKPLIEIETITDKKYDKHFRKLRLINRGWKGIEREYGTNKVVRFSQVNYYKQFASTYYAINCGRLCGAGNIVIFERIDGKWKILTEINLWMA
ncbi:hypothetical protein [Planktosalinus lacus]|uniref:Uncharacterized protein n=1 Tax=Planktosalinus lacus TaxID=1526573 RepID=A0A8J2VDT2_9FLAO|nr:hypothetical protein [Planktosalinus lacus]GGE02071.1 hypothetical protein GCM10011312_26800 [Planktosalinus lacus]